MVILNESKIKYEKLDELLEQQLQNIQFSQQVSMIIDLKEVVKKLFRPDIMTTIEKPKDLIEEIGSDIINIIGHYRNYFYKKGKYSNFYFLYSGKECEELVKIMPDYKKEYYQKYFHDTDNEKKIKIVEKAIKTCEKVIKLIPNAAFVETSKFDELVYTKFLIESIPTNQLIFILSNDPIFYQLPNKNVFILDLKGINSSLVTDKNAVTLLTKRETTISANLVPLIISLSGDKKYSLKGINHVALIKATQMVEALVKRGVVLDVSSTTIPLDFSKLNLLNNRMDHIILENQKQIEDNYKIIRCDNLLYENKVFIQTELSTANMRTSMDRPGYYLAEINAKIFVSHPLQLDMILKGEKI